MVVLKPPASRVVTGVVTYLLYALVVTGFFVIVYAASGSLPLDRLVVAATPDLIVPARVLVLWLLITAVLGAAFVTIQGFEFSKLVSEGVVFGNSQFASAFYFLTGNHGLHVIGRRTKLLGELFRREVLPKVRTGRIGDLRQERIQGGLVEHRQADGQMQGGCRVQWSDGGQRAHHRRHMPGQGGATNNNCRCGPAGKPRHRDQTDSNY
jgi:hypothetical protein